MPSKTEEYLALAQRTANGLTRYWESWTDYLTTASRLYKYPFADQLMIYAQRPDATACAEFRHLEQPHEPLRQAWLQGHRPVRPVQQCTHVCTMSLM